MAPAPPSAHSDGSAWPPSAACVRFVVERGIDVESLFTHRFKLGQAAAAYGLFDTQTTGKGVVEF